MTSAPRLGKVHRQLRSPDPVNQLPFPVTYFAECGIRTRGYYLASGYPPYYFSPSVMLDLVSNCLQGSIVCNTS